MHFHSVILFVFALYSANGASVKTEERKCGIHNIDLLKMNSTPENNKSATFGEFPWTVAIFKTNIITCAGSIIQPNVILTAAHCLKDVKKEEVFIKAGLWDVSAKNEQYPEQERNVSQIIMHPEFESNGKHLKNDIALIVVEKPFQLADHISLACLVNKDHANKSTECYAAGWGREGKDGKSASVLKKIHLPIVSKEDCEKKLKDKAPTFTIPENAICAGGEKASTCIGDGGAALACHAESDADKRYVQSGITSSGVGCRKEIPGVYTNVAAYRDWIDEHVRKLELDPKNYTF